MLHNGQVEIELGYSINTETMKNKMSETALVSRRIVTDYLKASSLETSDVEISNGLHNSVKAAASKYHSYLKSLFL